MNLFKNFAKDESGATAIEYGLIAALMAVIVIAAVGLLGPSLMGTFTNVSTSLTAPSPDLTPTPAPGG